MNEQLKHYHDFIDGLTKLNMTLYPKRVLEKGWPKIDENKDINDLLSRLSQADKEIISRIILHARVSGIHDTLVYLSDKEYKLVRDDIEIANEPYGTTLYWDYIARKDESEWPTHQLNKKYADK